MILPSRAIDLIREFSKPLTRPNWRKGALHVITLKKSRISHLLKCVIQHANGLFYLIRVYPEIYNTDTLIFDIIKKYGEHVFYYNNFYSCIRKYLLTKTSYFTYDMKRNEWIYTKRNCIHFWCNC